MLIKSKIIFMKEISLGKKYIVQLGQMKKEGEIEETFSIYPMVISMHIYLCSVTIKKRYCIEL